MTSITVQDHLQSPSRIDSTRSRILVAAALLAVAGVLFVWIVTGAGSGTSTHTLGGPNEAARGVAVYSATGGQVSPAGGPNEAARGQAASTASGSVVNPGGPDETARGQSVSAATSR
jgi:hypothetical protein